MQISIKSFRRNQSGWVLSMTLVFLLVTLIVFASIMYWISTNARITGQNNLYNQCEAAAQGADEIAIASMERDFIKQSINNSNVYSVLVTNINQTGWPVQFKFADTNGNANQIYVSIWPLNWQTNFQSLNSQWSGLFGAVANCDVIAVASPVGTGYNMSAQVEETSQLTGIPVFQFGVFYNMDLDIGNGQALTMNGKVHCNGTIWMCPQALMTFNDLVEASVVVTNADDPSDQQNHTFNSSNLQYILTTNNPVSKADTLTMPIAGMSGANPTNIEVILNLPPTSIAGPNALAYVPTNQFYLYNECDLIISNSGSGLVGASGTNITIFFQDQTGSPYYYQLTNNEVCTFQRISSPTNWPPYWTTNSPYRPFTNYALAPWASSFPFVTNVTYVDWREGWNSGSGKPVQAVQIDIAQLNIWLTNSAFEGYAYNQICGGVDGAHGHKGHPIDSIFVYTSVTNLPTQLPAVRVANGYQLPSPWGLTVATPFPVYVLGNYNIQTNGSGSQSVNTTNTAWTWPAALMGDSITILSGGWSDSNLGANPGGTTLTTVNAACLEGIVPSITLPGPTKQYSGGLENFLRLLENWNTTLCYNGSIVVMFPSIYATNYWQTTGHYYNAPTRKWGFDSNFTRSSGMPPCAPQAKAIIRGNWLTGGK
ncbi:MAG: hypothetical protein WAO02_08335 [Verrucomicrobiia bacterium]